MNDCVAELSASSATSVELNIVDASALALSRVTQAQAYHIVREALTNTQRHAQAQHVTVTVTRTNGRACFMIEDDGRGFERESVDEQQHLGLNIMRNAPNAAADRCTVESESGKGTKITALLPIQEGQ